MDENKLLDGLYRLTQSEYRPFLKEFIELRVKNVEDTLYSLKIDKYKANWSTIMIKMREAYNHVLALPELTKGTITEEKLKKEHEVFIDELIESLST
jgi:hypothetical protein